MAGSKEDGRVVCEPREDSRSFVYVHVLPPPPPAPSSPPLPFPSRNCGGGGGGGLTVGDGALLLIFFSIDLGSECLYTDSLTLEQTSQIHTRTHLLVHIYIYEHAYITRHCLTHEQFKLFGMMIIYEPMAFFNYAETQCTRFISSQGAVVSDSDGVKLTSSRSNNDVTRWETSRY